MWYQHPAPLRQTHRRRRVWECRPWMQATQVLRQHRHQSPSPLPPLTPCEPRGGCEEWQGSKGGASTGMDTNEPTERVVGMHAQRCHSQHLIARAPTSQYLRPHLGHPHCRPRRPPHASAIAWTAWPTSWRSSCRLHMARHTEDVNALLGTLLHDTINHTSHAQPHVPGPASPDAMPAPAPPIAYGVLAGPLGTPSPRWSRGPAPPLDPRSGRWTIGAR